MRKHFRPDLSRSSPLHLEIFEDRCLLSGANPFLAPSSVLPAVLLAPAAPLSGPAPVVVPTVARVGELVNAAIGPEVSEGAATLRGGPDLTAGLLPKATTDVGLGAAPGAALRTASESSPAGPGNGTTADAVRLSGVAIGTVSVGIQENQLHVVGVPLVGAVSVSGVGDLKLNDAGGPQLSVGVAGGPSSGLGVNLADRVDVGVGGANGPVLGDNVDAGSANPNGLKLDVSVSVGQGVIQGLALDGNDSIGLGSGSEIDLAARTAIGLNGAQGFDLQGTVDTGLGKGAGLSPAGHTAAVLGGSVDVGFRSGGDARVNGSVTVGHQDEIAAVSVGESARSEGSRSIQGNGQGGVGDNTSRGGNAAERPGDLVTLLFGGDRLSPGDRAIGSGGGKDPSTPARGAAPTSEGSADTEIPLPLENEPQNDLGHGQAPSALTPETIAEDSPLAVFLTVQTDLLTGNPDELAGETGAVAPGGIARSAADPVQVAILANESEVGDALFVPSPHAGGLLTGLLPFDFAALERDLESFLEQLEQLGGELSSLLARMNLSPWLVAIAVAAVAGELTRHQLQVSRRGPVLAACEGATLAWFPGLTGPWSPGGL